MSYTAIIARVVNIRPHPNADRLNLGTVQGYQIILGKDTQEGELGIFFPCDGKICHEHLMANKLYRKDPATGEPMGGYFEPNGRVKAQKLRGSMSDGFWQPLDSLSWAGDLSKLKEGDEVTEINGYKLCEKYYTPATQRAMNRNKTKGKKKRDPVNYSMLHEHYDTKQFRMNIHRIPEKALIVLSEKCHGTSGRTGHILIGKKNRWYHKWLAKLLKCEVSRTKWEYVSGSRRVILQPHKDDGYYKNTSFRQQIHEKIKSIGLYKGETLYYEIVGYTDKDGAIMGNYSVEDKEIKKQYGKSVVFSYGCEPNSPNRWRVLVYRITMVNIDGVETEYSRAQIEQRCAELGLEVVPLLAEPFVYDGDKATLYEKVYGLAQGRSLLDPKHPREGVVVRVEDMPKPSVFKLKSDDFCILENIRKNNPEYVDLEEAS